MRFFVAEVRHAGRALLRQPVFTLHVLVTLAVGIGATTAVFSVLNAVVLEPLPYPDSARLVVLWERHLEKGLVRERVAPGKFLDWRRENRVFAGVGAAWYTPANLTAQGAPERVNLARVTASWFPTLGIAPRVGRALVAADAQPESGRVAVLSTRLWQRRFGSDPKALGHTITLDGDLFTIVGIMPPMPAYPEEVDAWVPLVLGVWNRVSHSLLVIARLSPGIDMPRAQADAGLVIQSLISLQHVDPGFRTERVLTARVSLPLSLDRYRKEASRSAFWQLLLARVDGLPGVEAAGLTSSLPFSGTEVPFRFRVEGRSADTFADLLEAEYRAVSPSYFRVMGIALRDGRAFSDRDGHDGAGGAIVNETMAHRLSGWRLGGTSGRDVLGQRISVQGPDGPWWPIVGVVADVRHVGLDTAARPEIYVPFVQEGWPEMTVVIRTAGEPLPLGEPLRRLVQELDPEEPVHHVSALASLVDRSLSTRRFSTTLLAMFAAAALLLSMIGIHGVLSYLVSRRRREIGVRVAVGATRRDVVGLVLAEGLRLTLAGEIVGLVLALMLTRALASVLFGVGSRDPLTLAALFITLALTALVAMLVPARRAAAVDPLTVLRHE